MSLPVLLTSETTYFNQKTTEFTHSLSVLLRGSQTKEGRLGRVTGIFTEAIRGAENLLPACEIAMGDYAASATVCISGHH